MSQDQGDIFSKVSTEERQSLFKDLATAHGEIVCKGEGDEIYRLVAARITDLRELFCSFAPGSPKPLQEKELFGNFFLGGERYFFKTPVHVGEKVAVLRTDVELFHLQRRQNYRLKIPESYQSKFTALTRNQAPLKFSGRVTNLSLHGCAVVLKQEVPDLKTGDLLSVQLQIGFREPLALEGTVKHVKVEYLREETRQSFGIEFQSVTSQIEARLFSLTMDLYRELFSRINTRN